MNEYRLLENVIDKLSPEEKKFILNWLDNQVGEEVQGSLAFIEQADEEIVKNVLNDFWDIRLNAKTPKEKAIVDLCTKAVHKNFHGGTE